MNQLLKKHFFNQLLMDLTNFIRNDKHGPLVMDIVKKSSFVDINNIQGPEAASSDYLHQDKNDIINMLKIFTNNNLYLIITSYRNNGRSMLVRCIAKALLRNIKTYTLDTLTKDIVDNM
jgi:hypothetical protein